MDKWHSGLAWLQTRAPLGLWVMKSGLSSDKSKLRSRCLKQGRRAVQGIGFRVENGVAAAGIRRLSQRRLVLIPTAVGAVCAVCNTPVWVQGEAAYANKIKDLSLIFSGGTAIAKRRVQQ